jgi:hypothetical protein
MSRRIFLLSPASSAGKRCQMLVRPEATSELAIRLRDGGAPIGEVFSFLSSLYFRGKLAYAQRFAGSDDVLVITPGRGLVPADTSITMRDLRGFARVRIDAAERRYVRPLRADAEALRARLPRGADVVLLGSIATPKYVDVLTSVFGRSLLFPGQFVGRGDMSRGGLLLRAASAGTELDYQPVDGAVRRGPRAVKLAALGY